MTATQSPIAINVRAAAELASVSRKQIRAWCRLWRATRGRAGLRHARPAARLILIFPSDLASFLLSAVPR
jgi:transposase-like protein